MQPLKLRIDGLHSFRVPVEVDLAELGQHGLFGVFGPTGSGKSTLLDALTLALYGQVDRLTGRSRKGIVNHHRDRCEVRLDFRSGGTEWTVQRAYKKTDDGGASRIHSRLLREGPLGSEVVADKDREVNEQVEALLGLNAQDFMRAVVLPQGRFMQFLHLQGSERRRMLQRLFRLEAYGEELRGKVKSEAGTVDRALQRVLGELAGLGQAGATDLASAAKAATEAKTTRDRTAAELEAATTALEAAQKRWSHQTELETAHQALQDHLRHTDAMETLREQIQLARRVRPVLARLAAADQADGELTKQRDTATSLGARLDQVRADATTLEEAWRAAAEERSRQEPALSQRRDALGRAVALEEELERVTEAAGQAERRRAQLAKKQQGDEHKLLQLEKELRELLAEKTRLSNLVLDQNVNQALREQVDRAQGFKRTLEAARERAAELKDAKVATRKRRESAQATETKASEAVRIAEERLERARHWTAHLASSREALQPLVSVAERLRSEGLVARLAEVATQERRIGRQLEKARAEQEAAAEALEALSHEGLTQKLAGVLAAELDGPCPVCGSEDHPHPAPTSGADALLEVVQEQARIQARLGVAEAAVERAEAEQGRTREQRAALEAQIPSEVGDPAAFLKREKAARAALERAVARAEHSGRALAPNLEEARRLLAAAAAQRGSLADQEQREQDELDTALQTEGTAWGALQEELGSFTLFDLPRLAEEIQRKDRTREELQPRLEKADRALAKANERYSGRRTRVVEQGAELDQIGRKAVELADRRGQLLTELRTLVPEGSAAQQAREVTEKLEALARAANERHRELESVRRTLLEVTADRSAALGRLQAAEVRAREARAEADEALASHGFSAHPTSEDALPSVDLDAREREVRAWQNQRAALAMAHQRLAAIALDPIDAEALETARTRRTTAARQDAEAHDALVRATERHEQLQRRASRHRELTTQQQTLSERADQLASLARLLRGDRFVEYVANDYLTDLVQDATQHLGLLTRGRYALDLDDQGGFLVADLDAGGALRPAHSLSGGETFLTSLALALALSTQVQHHKAQALDFFFLDEGFGSLDPDALDRVMTAIEMLSSEHRVIGLISHVGAVKERVPRYVELSNPRDASGTAITYRES